MKPSPPHSSSGRHTASARAWGYERADCRGGRALGFFIDDLHRVLAQHTLGREASSAAVMAAQRGVDELLRHYVRVGAHPAAFNGQTIVLKQGMDAQGVHHVVPIFSQELKQALIALLPPAQPGTQ